MMVTAICNFYINIVMIHEIAAKLINLCMREFTVKLIFGHISIQKIKLGSCAIRGKIMH